MKKYLILPTVLFSILAVAFALNIQSLHAEDSQGDVNVQSTTETNGDRTEVRTQMHLNIEAMREQGREKMAALRTDIKNERDAGKAKIKELRIAGRERALERFDKVVARIKELQDKVNAQITKFEAKGVAVADAKASVATSQTKLDAAQAKVVEINTLLAASTNELTAEDKTKLRTLVRDTQTLIVEAHQALRDAVKSLRAAVKLKIEAKAEVKTNPETSTETDQ